MTTPRLQTYLAPFRTESGQNAYLAIVRDGPLGRLFAEESTRLGAAKGGSDPRFAKYHDQSHFQHGLTVAVGAGLLFESGMITHRAEACEADLRLIMAAGALHDFNKIMGTVYPTCLEANAGQLVALIGDYVPNEDRDSVLHLILATEDGFDADADRYLCRLSGNVLLLAKAALSAADTLASGSDERPLWNPKAYSDAITRLRRKHPLLPEIQVAGLHDIPQTALEATIREALVAWIRRNGSLLHDSPRCISWIGTALDEEAIHVLERDVEARVKPPFGEFAPSIKIHSGSGSLPVEWVNQYPPSRETVLTLIHAKGPQLIFWGGDWGARNLKRLAERAPCFQAKQKGDGSSTVKLVMIEDHGTAAGQRQQLQAEIILASCLRHNVDGDIVTTNPNADEWQFKDCEARSRKFIAGILDVIDTEPTQELLNRLLDSCVTSLSAKARNPDDGPLKNVVHRTLGISFASPPPGQTGRACVVCGSQTNTELVAQDAFGTKTDAWFPRSAAIQAQKDDIKICLPCQLDSAVRAQLARDAATNVRGNAVYLHVHRSDTAVDGHLLETMKTVNPKRVSVDGGREGMLLYARGDGKEEPVIRHDNHVTIPIPSPGDMEDQFRLLETALRFASDTGHKTQVTSLGGIPILAHEQFSWQNAPSWVANLRPRDRHGPWSSGLAAVRVDRIAPARRILHAIGRAAYLNKTGKKVNYRGLVSALSSRPLGLYRYPARAEKNSTETHSTDILEEAFMDGTTTQLLNEAAHAYCKFNTRDAAAWGKSNHWQWATRTTLQGLSRGNDLARQALRGRLLQESQRKNPAARAEDVDAFVTAIEAIHAAHSKDNDQVDRDIIAAIAWHAERVYMAEYSKRARQAKEEELHA